MSAVKSLNEFIDLNGVECLNEDISNKITNVWKSDSSFLKSSDDEQLLVKISFHIPVKLSELRIRGVKGGVEEGFSPKHIKLFTNMPFIGFSEAENDEAVQEMRIEKDDYKKSIVDDMTIIPLRFVKFQNVSNLAIFVVDNFGSHETRIQQIELFGIVSDSMNMNDWKPLKEGEKLVPDDS